MSDSSRRRFGRASTSTRVPRDDVPMAEHLAHVATHTAGLDAADDPTLEDRTPGDPTIINPAPSIEAPSVEASGNHTAAEPIALTEAPHATATEPKVLAKPSEAVSAEEGFWTKWNVQPVEGHPQDPWVRQACPSCHTSAALLVQPAGTRFACAQCGFQGDARLAPHRYAGHVELGELRWPHPATDLDAAAILVQSGLEGYPTDALYVAQAYFTDQGLPGWRDALFLPVHAEAEGAVVDLLQVELTPTGTLSDTHRRAKTGQPYPWGWDQVTEDKVLFVERPVDALALHLSGQPHAVCLPSSINPAHASGGDYAPLALIEERMRTIHRVELAFQDDEAGHRLEEELSRRMGRDRCFRLRWHSHAVAEDVIASAWAVYGQYGAEGVVESLAALAPYPVAGIYELVDVDEEFESYYEFGFVPGARIGYPSMDVHYAAPEGQLTMILGIPSHGKSTLAEDIAVSLAERYDWGIGVFSPENQPVARYFASLTEKYVRKPFSDLGVDCPKMSKKEKDAGKHWVQNHFRVILPDDEGGNWSLDAVLERARTLVYRHGIKGLVLDPWNELDHARPAHMTHDDYLAQQLAKLKRFARVNGIHVWVVAHPTKLEHKADGRYPVPTPYTTAGGAMWFNKSDFILVPYRHRGDIDEEIVDVYVQKVRQREHGRVGMFSLYYNELTCRYEDRVNNDARRRSKDGNQTLRTEQQLLAHVREALDGMVPA